MKHYLFLVISLIALVFKPTYARADDQPSSTAQVDQLFDAVSQVRGFREAAISPDSKRLAWVGSSPGTQKSGRRRAWGIYVTDWQSEAAEPQRITAGNTARTEHSISWSPDGSRLAFLSDQEKSGQLQVYTVSASGSEARQLTRLTGLLAQPRWSPDGRFIAFLFTENASRSAGPIGPGAALTGVIGEKTEEQRLAVVDVDSEKMKLLSPKDMYVYEFDWSPDSKRLAAIAAHGSGDNNWYIAQLYTVGLGSPEMKSIWKPRMQIAVPRWSPDGQNVAVIGGLMSDEGANGGDIYLVPENGGKPRNLTPGLKASAAWLAWVSPSRLIFTEHILGHSGVAALNVNDGTVANLWTGPESVSAEGGSFSLSLARDGDTSALIRHSFQQPPEVWAGRIGKWKQLTHANEGLRPRWGEAKSLHWKSDDKKIQGWLLFPRDFDRDKKYPLLVSVHGGPASSRRPSWPRPSFDLSIFSNEGYFVLFPNPRGSFGQGEEFTRANVKDFGYGDLRDIMSGVDEVLRIYPVDKDRMAIAGWSYGGYMTMWAVTQTNRFRAAVAGAGIANWQSYYGQNGIDQWLLPYFGASVYDDPAVYARSSPINFIKNVRTPTLILVGERDVECPPPQSMEFWHALKTFNVPTELVIYPNEGHGVGRPDHRRDILRRSVSWLNRYVRDRPSSGGGRP